MEILKIGYIRGASGTASPTIVKWREWIEPHNATQNGYWLYFDLT